MSWRGILLNVSMSLLPAVALAASEDVVLRCKGTIASFAPTTWTADDEEIVARITGNAMTFSGNSLLLGRDIKVARIGDDIYFDSDTCGGPVTTQTRQYGTFNRILMTLVLTNTIDRLGHFVGLTGHFKCVRVLDR
jgi:hypothetical protein